MLNLLKQKNIELVLYIFLLNITIFILGFWFGGFYQSQLLTSNLEEIPDINVYY